MTVPPSDCPKTRKTVNLNKISESKRVVLPVVWIAGQARNDETYVILGLSQNSNERFYLLFRLRDKPAMTKL
jgi:hypothetical protein